VPNIRELNAPSDLAIRPDDRAMEATANAGRRISALYSSAAESTLSVGRTANSTIQDLGNTAVRFMDNREISNGAKNFATLMAGLDAEWNKRVSTADPNDPAVAQKFLEEVVNPRLDQMREGFNTENSTRFAETQIQHLRTHFVSKTSSDMATLAGVAAKSNINTLTNQLSNAAISDPSSLKTSLKLVEGSIGAMVDSSPTLSGVNAGKLKLELTEAAQAAIVKAAAIGAISANPEAGLKKFSGPEYSKYISGAELRQLEQQARAVERAQRVDENYRRKNAELAKEEASDAREGEYLQQLHSDDPKERAKVSAAAIANDFTLTRQARERMIGIVERELKPAAAAKISSDTANDLISRIRAPEGDPRRITDLNPVYEAYEKGKLNKSDFKFVTDEFKNIRTPDGEELGRQQDEFLKSVKPMIDKSNPLLGKIDQSGGLQMYAFTLALKKKVEEYRKAGKDPRDLMDPSKPDFMGSPAALSQFQKPLQQSLQDVASSLRTGPSVPISGAPAPSASNPPASLRGIASLTYSPSRKQYRDDATGKIYDLNGNEVK
jgi:hypothetical protein